MARFDERPTFVPAVEAAFGKENIIVVKDAQGGQPIRRWCKQWPGTGGQKPEEIGDLYDRLMGKVKPAIEGEDIATVTFVWMQGEADARAGNGQLYKAALKGLADQLSEDLGRTDINFVIGRLSDCDMANSRFPDWTMIREIQVEIAESSSRYAWVNTDDLNDGIGKGGKPVKNDLHYTKEGYGVFGERLAAAAVKLIRAELCFGGAMSVHAAESFPHAEELPVLEELPDPFQFFRSERRVGTRDDWEERRAEMLDMVLHYMYGPAFPQVNLYKVERRSEQLVDEGRVMKYTADLKMGRALNSPVSFVYYLPRNTESNSVLIYAVGQEGVGEEEAIEITRRGYGFTVFEMGPSEKMARASFPDIDGTRNMGWVWGINEYINYLVLEHAIDKIILTGCSRYGRVAIIAGAMNKRVDLTAPITTLAHAVHHYDESRQGPGNVKWATPEYDTFAGQMNKMPVDRHFLGAVIAPRGYLCIMGAEKPSFNQGHVEAYDALIPVYEWLGARNNLGLYDHSPRGHGVNSEDLHTVLDFADMIFLGRELRNEADFYTKNSGPARSGSEDLDTTKGWAVPPPLGAD
jgi:hypothetical protein